MTEATAPFLLWRASNVSVDHDGRRLIGGSPQRIMTLSPSGARLVAGWFTGEPVGPEPAHQALARRLVEADLALPVGQRRGIGTTDLAVVIPVKDDPEGLTATLAAFDNARLRPPEPGSRTAAVSRIVIVDDGSDPPVDPAIGDRLGVSTEFTVVRRSTSAGPGNARNLGVRYVEAPMIVFVDAGVVVTEDQLHTLADELCIGDTVAAAPRVRSEILPTRLARYERTWSPLDLGQEPGLVGPGRRISYVPSTCLAVRTSALIASGGFDPGLRFGEDVDLVWRLGVRGWVRYVPSVEVTHPPRSTLGGFVRQRYRYGTSAGPLSRRHGWAVAPARLDSRSAATWAALVTGFRLPAALIAVSATVVYIASLIRRGVPPRRAARMVTAGWIGTTRGLALSTARTWWPLAALAATRPRFRLAPCLLIVGWLRRARWRRPVRPNTDRADAGALFPDLGTELALGVVDDSAYALGVWRGSIRARTMKPLLPHIPIGRSRSATER
ncbi:MAG: mycofactocin biosynthesis glycosyltransferase MftF [Acidimicrobiia bacterium]|nr:mycofactocin biosynthesis glycosyltransferase MftF [Acidimicrobiia bacterium]